METIGPEVMHFMKTDKGYIYCSSTCYDETEFNEIEHTQKLMSQTEKEKIAKMGWQDVREWIKNILEYNK